MKVAVYGTLRKDQGNHLVMERAGGKFLYEEFVEGILLRDYCWGFPAASYTGESVHKTFVEVYEVDDLAPLDRLEGFSEGSDHNFYTRRVIPTSGGNVFIYTIDSCGAPPILEGDWVKFKRDQKGDLG